MSYIFSYRLLVHQHSVDDAVHKLFNNIIIIEVILINFYMYPVFMFCLFMKYTMLCFHSKKSAPNVDPQVGCYTSID